MAALTDYSKWDAIDDSSDAESDAGQQSAPKEDPVLTGAKNVVCQLRAKLSLLPEGTLDEGWTSPPLPGGASKRELFTATCDGVSGARRSHLEKTSRAMPIVRLPRMPAGYNVPRAAKVW